MPAYSPPDMINATPVVLASLLSTMMFLLSPVLFSDNRFAFIIMTICGAMLIGVVVISCMLAAFNKDNNILPARRDRLAW